MLGAKGKDSVVAGQRGGIVPQVMEGRALVDPCLDEPRVELDQLVVRFDLFLRAAKFVEGGRETHPSLLGVPVIPQGLREALQGSVEVARPSERVTAKEPSDVVLGFEAQRLVEGAQRLVVPARVERLAAR